jgi:hypothetical protein
MTRLRYLAIPFLLLIFTCCSKQSHPSDAALIQNFNQREAAFEGLLTMIRADQGLERVDNTWTRPGDPSTIGITPERIRSYRKLFSTLGIPRGFHASHNPERFTLVASARGLSVSGSGKGYVYTVEKPSSIVTNLDTYWPADGRSFTAYRHIKGNWYLYFDFED